MFKEIYLRWIGILFIGLVFPLILNINKIKLLYPHSYWIDAGFSIFYTAICWNCAIEIMSFFRKRYAGYYQTKKRVLYSVPTVIFMVFFINIVVAYTIDTYIINIKCTLDWSDRWRVPFIATIFSIALCALYEGFYIYQQLQASILEAQKFQTENIKSQFEVLKNQIDPHFLFNSLNTLATVITENPNIAVNFAEKLSQVYRYILQNKDKEQKI